MKQIPEEGKFTFLDSGWMEQTVKEVLNGELEGDAYERRIESISVLKGSLRTMDIWF